MIRACAVSALLLATATPALALQDADYSAAITETARNVIIPAYQTLERATVELGSSLDALCKRPDYDAMVQAQGKFKAVTRAWARIQFISFGPISEHQRANRIEYWPDKRNIVGRQLADLLQKQDLSALEPEHFATTTVGVQGLPALDRLLFEDGARNKLAPDTPGAPFRCALLHAIAANLNSITHEVVAGWTGGQQPFLSRIQHPSEADEVLPSGRAAAARLLNDLLTSVIAMRDMKLLVPLGDSLEKAKPQAAELWRSGQSSAILNENIRGLKALFGSTEGLGKLLAVGDNQITLLQMKGLLEMLINDAIAVGGGDLPLDKAVTDREPRESVERLINDLGQLRDILAGPVATKLNLPIGFNALDGD
jgi:predicted lipoprotein